MNRPAKGHDFRAASRRATADAPVVAAVRKTASTLRDLRAARLAGEPAFEALREWGRARKRQVSGDLERYVQRFAEGVTRAGGTVHFARDGAEAGKIVTGIARRLGVKTAVKSKSMTAEEIGLNEMLEAAGVAVTETDLGEFIIQLAGEKPSHILAPAIHRSRAQVAELFTQRLGAPPDLPVEGLVRWARGVLRQRFLSAPMGITGGNFAVADTGTVALVTNEGNGRMVTSLPPVHVALVGIDKVIPSLGDLPNFLELLTYSGTGQRLSSYLSLTTGPRGPGEGEGPEELHVVLLDNGRSRIRQGPFREILHCLHCGACLNHCPVYRAVGGHAYGSPYCGPMGSVFSTLLWGSNAYPDLPDACTLCGRCAEVCPSKIPLPDYHRGLRRERATEGGLGALVADLTSRVASHPVPYRSGVAAARGLLGSGLAPLVPEPEHGAVRSWRVCRELPRPEPGVSFRSWWKKHRRAEVGSRPTGAVGPATTPPGAPARERGTPPSPLDLYVERARAAGTEVERFPEGELARRLAGIVREEAVEAAAVPAAGWPGEIRNVATTALGTLGCSIVAPVEEGGTWSWDRTALAGAGLGVTWAEAFVAHTGSLAFPSGPGLGTLASLLPEVHLTLSRPDGVVPGLDDLLSAAPALPSRLTLVTGPSRTGDIEGTLTAGVHGPRRVLHWILEPEEGRRGSSSQPSTQVLDRGGNGRAPVVEGGPPGSDLE